MLEEENGLIGYDFAGHASKIIWKKYFRPGMTVLLLCCSLKRLFVFLGILVSLNKSVVSLSSIYYS